MRLPAARTTKNRLKLSNFSEGRKPAGVDSGTTIHGKRQVPLCGSGNDDELPTSGSPKNRPNMASRTGLEKVSGGAIDWGL